LLLIWLFLVVSCIKELFKGFIINRFGKVTPKKGNEKI